jgi:2-C-methyl-D-erythritol 4-phosphate cytidylyltransferase/2-C-methyl-D-erythritol 2,4-cyclodiphosphate synthase
VTSNASDVAAIIVAAGRGLRAQTAAGTPKQYRKLGGRPVLAWAMQAFLDAPAIDRIVTVIGADDGALFGTLGPLPDRHAIAFGAATRQGSVHAGLEALAANPPEIVLVHDAARPFLSGALIERSIDAARTHGAAVPGVPVADTIAEIDAAGRRLGTLVRDRLRAVQTPHAFRFPDLLDAHRRAAAAGRDDFTDDGALAAWAGMEVAIFEGDAMNSKLTTADDILAAERRIAASMPTETRTGTGYDVHAFGDGDHVMLCGLAVPHERGLLGHSDADVALHALTDALLGAIGDGDIGAHFPPSDPQWKGAASARFLEDAVARVTARGGRIVHLDTTIVCEAPRVGPHREAMRKRLAEIAGVEIDRVSVKATTSEKLGFTGRREGIAALAAATVELPRRG